MRIVYFGTYSTGEGYPRNRVLIDGLRRCGVEVAEIHREFWRDAGDKIAGATGGRGRVRLGRRYLGVWLKLAAAYARAGRHDAVVVGYTGQIDVFLARALAATTGRPVVLDAFLSLYDTLVHDRGLVREGGPFAALLRWLDRASSRAADLVLLDTEAHVDHFVRATGLPRRRFARLFVGEDDRAFPPVPATPRRPGEPLRVLWFGTWVPLQGAATILDAAALLKEDDVRIRMVGRGQQLEELRSRADAAPNVDLVPRWVSYEELRREIAAAHVCLGVFGTTAKAGRVIPCKVFDALAVGRPVVTADTVGVRELLAPDEDAILVPSGDAAALAAALRRLAGNDDLRLRVARSGHEVYRRRASPAVLGAEFRDRLQALRTSRTRR